MKIRDGVSVSDEEGRVRAINHNQAPLTLDAKTPLELAQTYLREAAEVYGIAAEQIDKIDQRLDGEARLDETASFRLEQEKQSQGRTVVSFSQTYFNLPVRMAGVDVVMQNKPLRALSSSASFYPEIQVDPPKSENLDRFRKLSAEDLAKTLASDNAPKTLPEIAINQTRFMVYRYAAKERQFVLPENKNAIESLPTFPLPKLPETIADGKFYVTLETYFSLPLPDRGRLNWLALLEVETGAVLLLRALISHANGYVFLTDPITKSGSTANAASSNNATLNPFRDDMGLVGLNPASAAGVQSLVGSLVNVSSTNAVAPTESAPFNFYYNVRTNNFSAVNAYYNCDRFFRLISELGINRATYLDGTSFPVPVDHRAGNTVNANCAADAAGDGIGRVNFLLADSSNIADPIGSATDWRTVLHEIGGHGILYDHIQNGQANLGFSHSQGDSFAAMLNDPESNLTGANRFITFPFTGFWDEDGVVRRHDRDVAAGWGWGAIHDNSFTSGYLGYESEQILSTILFRLYRSMGGDAVDVNQKRFAARFASFILFTTVGSLTSTSAAAIRKTSQTDYVPVTDYEIRMESADLEDFSPVSPPGTHTGGAYYKVIRWAFEKQGLFRAAGAVVTTAGSPPPVDVYIDDGRAGEYQYLDNHWSCQDIWNRNHDSGDGGGVHQEPIVGFTNFAWVRIKNRGSQPATNVVVKGFHCLPGVGLVYPDDWIPMTDASLTAPDVAAHDSVGIVVGPFQWVPSQLGHECMFFSVTADGDASNIDGRITGSIPEWRLVPHDNNIAQRNVAPVPASSGSPGLRDSFRRRPFFLRNTLGYEAGIKLVASMPKFLSKLGWELEFVNAEGANFKLGPGKRLEILLDIKAGEDFSRALVLDNALDSTITVTAFADGIIIGGMSYRLDPDLKMPGEKPKDESPDGLLERFWRWLINFIRRLFKG